MARENMDWVDWVEIERGSNWRFGKLWIHKKVNVKASSLHSKNHEIINWVERVEIEWIGKFEIFEREMSKRD